MNSRTARLPGGGSPPDVEAAAYLTLGSGSRATAGDYAQQPGPLPLDRLRTDNASLDHAVTVGALGDLLHAHGLRTLITGSEDDTRPRRAARLLLADSQGQIDWDETVQSGHDPDALSPYGYISEPVGLNDTGATDLRVMVYSDLARAEKYAPLCLPEVAAKHRTEALKRLEKLLAYYPKDLSDRTLLIVSPVPSNAEGAGDRLTPFLLRAPGVSAGLATSGSTHTPGLVTNTDFLPTVAALFRLPIPRGVIGRPITSVSAGAAGPTVEQWAALHDDWLARSRQQAAFGGLPTIQALLVVLSLASLQMRKRGGHWKLLPPAPLLGAAIVALPVVQLLLPPLAPRQLVTAGVCFAGVWLLVSLAVHYAGRGRRNAAVPLLAVLTAAILIDLVTGGTLLRQAWLSYSVMEGARYYGIGNEYVGALFAASLCLAAGGTVSRRTPLFAVLALLAVAVVVGHPGSGANAGGLIGMLVGYGVAGVVWLRGRLRLRDVVVVLLLAAGALEAALFLDAMRGAGSQTHIARALGDPSAVGLTGVALRKLSLNLYLLTHSVWTLPLAATLAAIWWSWRTNGLAGIVQQKRSTTAVAAGLTAGAAALFVFNDSGLLAAAECLLVTWGAVCCELALIGVSANGAVDLTGQTALEAKAP